jgi:hypothetical protein
MPTISDEVGVFLNNKYVKLDPEKYKKVNR